MRDDKSVLRVFEGEAVLPPPLWMMRQAGRYLAEYKEVRAKAGSFLNLCYSPELACEVTLQPIRRYGFDAAIIFSDILTIPDALGQNVRFEEGEGPVLDPISFDEIDGLDANRISEHLSPVYEAVSKVRAALDKSVTLYGFCGAPWTVATYMIAGRGGIDHGVVRREIYRDEAAFEKLIDLLVACSIDHLNNQIEAGADVVQIFESWAGSLGHRELELYSVDAIRRICDGVKAKHANTPIVVFPRATGLNLLRYKEIASVDGISVDWSQDLRSVREFLGDDVVLQGNIDPEVLLVGGYALERAVDEALEAMAGGRYIFNLGHGIGPQTPTEHVQQMIDRVRR